MKKYICIILSLILFFSYFTINISAVDIDEKWFKQHCQRNADTTHIPQNDESTFNEGPYILKNEGKYYLTYSVNGYTDHNYCVRLAVSDSPLGSYIEKGTILEKAGESVGTGHHCFTTSPDSTKLFIVYHCHYSRTQVHPRYLCIDRCKFINTQNKTTISVYVPTSNAQLYPSNNKDK